MWYLRKPNAAGAGRDPLGLIGAETLDIFPIRLREIPGGRELIRGELEKLGRVSRGEWTVLCVFLLTALAWIVREPLTHWTALVERISFPGAPSRRRHRSGGRHARASVSAFEIAINPFEKIS